LVLQVFLKIRQISVGLTETQIKGIMLRLTGM